MNGNKIVAMLQVTNSAWKQNFFLRQGWHEDDRRRTSFQSVPTLVGGVAGNGDKIRVGFVGIVIKRGVL